MTTLLQALVTGLTIVILAYVLLSYVLEPYHPVRMTLDRLVRPLLQPIRRLVPPVGMIDFSPFILLIVVQVVGALLIQLLTSG